ncbi:Flagellar basal body-associated protein FliL [Rhodobacteraceae bacterium THAF1]|uniref:flagellar basal body-associated FliL family protein n=1 Tax=Palleronia sp. THAF1 TaxID=2587842 RepID=UPI000F3D4197|nr:flagellar basal body-associated FliL family protein [Palleronia sp. THAF1]QFU10283.1 Flagellar basal body-associated protein FliL [Palleronia sp. THAF1]VDC16812.1 Flagellar basal body-associated protein FliL [Rhodobacteraceae bacterium THAF1]
MKLLIPIALALVGLGAGVGAGFALRPSPELPDVAQTENPCGEVAHTEPDHAKDDSHDAPSGDPIFVSLDHQFVVPIIKDGRVDALVVLSLTLETDSAAQDIAQKRKPRLRDRFLRVMLDHANTSGFEGNFTSNGKLDRLKTALMETARAEIGPGLYDVLLLDIVKQAA